MTQHPSNRVKFHYTCAIRDHGSDLNMSMFLNVFFVCQAVLKMLNEIGSVENIPDFIEGVKNR
jgi:hypothetical protein